MNDQNNIKKVTPTGLWHLGVVYVVWSSTYLAIRVAVREGGGFPPFTLGFMRVMAAAAILMIWSRFSKLRIKPTQGELRTLVIVGILMFNGGNGLVTWAEQRADSSFAAIMVAAIPIWSAIMEAIIDRKMPSPLLTAALLGGFAGIGILVAPSLSSGIEADVAATTALIWAGITWSLGSVLQARRPVGLHPRVSSAYQMFFGGLGFALLIFLTHEPRPDPTPAAWGAYAFLVIFGSVIAFTSYVTALQILPTKIVMTYPFVNPVLAVLLGWAILGEEITLWTIGGTLMVLLGVAGVFRERYASQAQSQAESSGSDSAVR